MRVFTLAAAIIIRVTEDMLLPEKRRAAEVRMLAPKCDLDSVEPEVIGWVPWQSLRRSFMFWARTRIGKLLRMLRD
jgi:hypothetical protein